MFSSRRWEAWYCVATAGKKECAWRNGCCESIGWGGIDCERGCFIYLAADCSNPTKRLSYSPSHSMTARKSWDRMQRCLNALKILEPETVGVGYLLQLYRCSCQDRTTFLDQPNLSLRNPASSSSLTPSTVRVADWILAYSGWPKVNTGALTEGLGSPRRSGFHSRHSRKAPSVSSHIRLCNPHAPQSATSANAGFLPNQVKIICRRIVRQMSGDVCCAGLCPRHHL